MRIPRFLSKLIPGFEVIDIKEWRNASKIEIYFKKKGENNECFCSRCGEKLQSSYGKYRLKLKHLPIFEQDCYLILWREKRFCPGCKKVRSEALDFVSRDTPHLTQEYAYWLGRMFEIASVKKVAQITRNDKSSMHRLDFNRLKRMVQNYKIPDVSGICVDEVCAKGS